MNKHSGTLQKKSKVPLFIFKFSQHCNSVLLKKIALFNHCFTVVWEV